RLPPSHAALPHVVAVELVSVESMQLMLETVIIPFPSMPLRLRTRRKKSTTEQAFACALTPAGSHGFGGLETSAPGRRDWFVLMSMSLKSYVPTLRPWSNMHFWPGALETSDDWKRRGLPSASGASSSAVYVRGNVAMSAPLFASTR